ncbi:MAG TPA: c-type cytochrome [Beijerinckiaceae bacterium]|jgi:cytochrome c|nr:c-type cytochrome [Beijerinckiaceae bacterium]
MDSFEFNKIAGGLLGTLLFTMALGILSDALFYRPAPAAPGYDLPKAQEAGPAAAAPAQPEVPLPVLLAKEDAKKGEADARACTVCHSFDKGGGVKIGPPLYGVVGRPVASVPGYPYSDTLKKVGGNWTFAQLFRWIAGPKAMASDTKMTYPGEPDPDKRAAIIDYLDSLSDNPVPLPAAEQGAAPTPAPASAPGGAAPAAPAPAASAPASPSTPAPETPAAPH